MLEPDVINRIRTIFLHHEPRVTIADAAGLLGWSRAEMNAAIRNGEIEVVGTCSGKRIELRELAAYALQQWPLTAIEEALGRDATLILPPALRTRKLTVRLPQYQIGALQVLADDAKESVDAMLTRMFEELADINHERLARSIPGLAEAMVWPDVGESGTTEGLRRPGPSAPDPFGWPSLRDTLSQDTRLCRGG